jgi:prefoldin subunit 5
MRARLLTTTVTAAMTLTAAAHAAEDKPGRYTMTPTDGGILKLDTVTGATSLCTRVGNDVACQPTKDGEQVLRSEIDGLKSEIQVLKEQLTKTEELAGIGDPRKSDGPRPGADGPRPQSKAELPTEKDVDQAFDYFERMVKKLKERLKKLDNEGKPGTPL